MTVAVTVGERVQWVLTKHLAAQGSKSTRTINSIGVCLCVYIQLKSEVYIHLSQIHLKSDFHNS
jgi:hypothetical protein